MTDSPFWTRARHADRRPFLTARATIIAAIRAWFAEQGFIEVDAGALVASPGAEVHLQAFQTGGRYLHTSPEFAMKKLLAAGEEKIFFLGKVYRAGDSGPLHAPEFTMLEWYRAHEPYERVQDDCIAIARVACRATGAHALSWRTHTCDPFAAPRRLTVREALAGGPRPSIPHAASDQPTDIFSRAIVAVEPTLGHDRLTLLDEYPITEAALARPHPHDPSLAERFELYACGVELANGFGELTDPIEQRARLEAAMAEKERRYGARWPIDEDFLAALAHMPPASGCALGIDRLVMLAAGAVHIDQVLWTPR
ncbi:MAG: EF-P lysine aminoacylase GenX [Alphaproteobacteria bacterium]|nr:EF-P lysine aminoacylase GenX [Alphaproteobacteria bacterium]